MLVQKDLQAIEILLDQKFKENNKILKDEVVSEIGEVTSEAFTKLESRLYNLDNEMAKRPTKEEIFSWADRRIINLEIAKDRHDYLHIDELAKLPTPLEISKTLIKRGFKKLN